MPDSAGRAGGPGISRPSPFQYNPAASLRAGAPNQHQHHQESTLSQDKQFYTTFFTIMGGLAVLAIILIILAGNLTSDLSDYKPKDVVLENIKPVGQVNIAGQAAPAAATQQAAAAPTAPTAPRRAGGPAHGRAGLSIHLCGLSWHRCRRGAQVRRCRGVGPPHRPGHGHPAGACHERFQGHAPEGNLHELHGSRAEGGHRVHGQPQQVMPRHPDAIKGLPGQPFLLRVPATPNGQVTPSRRNPRRHGGSKGLGRWRRYLLYI